MCVLETERESLNKGQLAVMPKGYGAGHLYETWCRIPACAVEITHSQMQNSSAIMKIDEEILVALRQKDADLRTVVVAPAARE